VAANESLFGTRVSYIDPTHSFRLLGTGGDGFRMTPVSPPPWVAALLLLSSGLWKLYTNVNGTVEEIGKRHYKLRGLELGNQVLANLGARSWNFAGSTTQSQGSRIPK